MHLEPPLKMRLLQTGRIDNIKTANLIATYLHQNGRVDVVVSLVNPFEELRKELRKLNGEKQVLEILLKSNRGDKKSSM